MAKRCCSNRNQAFIAQLTLVLILPWLSRPATGNPVQTDAASESSAQGAQESRTEWLKTDFGPTFDAQQWEFLGGGWTHDPQGMPPALRLARKQSDYSPPHRSPTHLALWRQSVEGSFEMTVDVISTHEDYGHRDVCFFFGWQDPAHFYYIHLAKQTDPHANQIFIVDGADRKAISLETSDGTPWDEAMHSVRIRRDIDTGEIAFWFDDSEKPVMLAVDKTFLSGRIGLGSFDDTADFYRLEVVATGIGAAPVELFSVFCQDSRRVRKHQQCIYCPVTHNYPESAVIQTTLTHEQDHDASLSFAVLRAHPPLVPDNPGLASGRRGRIATEVPGYAEHPYVGAPCG